MEAHSGADAGISAVEVVDSPRIRPLTNAERQKRWREKQGDKYRKWNRERMKEFRRAQKADPSS